MFEEFKKYPIYQAVQEKSFSPFFRQLKTPEFWRNTTTKGLPSFAMGANLRLSPRIPAPKITPRINQVNFSGRLYNPRFATPQSIKGSSFLKSSDLPGINSFVGEMKNYSRKIARDAMEARNRAAFQRSIQGQNTADLLKNYINRFK